MPLVELGSRLTMTGTINRTPNNAAMAPAVLRINVPKPKRQQAENRQIEPGADHTSHCPGSANGNAEIFARKDRLANEEGPKAESVATRNVTMPITVALAASRVRRCGVAAKVVGSCRWRTRW